MNYTGFVFHILSNKKESKHALHCHLLVRIQNKHFSTIAHPGGGVVAQVKRYFLKNDRLRTLSLQSRGTGGREMSIFSQLVSEHDSVDECILPLANHKRPHSWLDRTASWTRHLLTRESMHAFPVLFILIFSLLKFLNQWYSLVFLLSCQLPKRVQHSNRATTTTITCILLFSSLPLNRLATSRASHSKRLKTNWIQHSTLWLQ